MHNFSSSARGRSDLIEPCLSEPIPLSSAIVRFDSALLGPTQSKFDGILELPDAGSAVEGLRVGDRTAHFVIAVSLTALNSLDVGLFGALFSKDLSGILWRLALALLAGYCTVSQVSSLGQRLRESAGGVPDRRTGLAHTVADFPFKLRGVSNV